MALSTENADRVGAQRKLNSTRPAERLVSLDAYRGFIMMMLAASGFGILAFSRIDASSPVWEQHDREFWQSLAFHFEHPAWISSFDSWKVSFWDLIQPAFMFMVGVSMPYSDASRVRAGHGALRRGFHAATRAVVLTLIGVVLYSMGHQRTNWVFPNVLCQIGLGYFVAWMLQNLRWFWQLTAIAVILGGYWGLFYMYPPPENYDFEAVDARTEKGEVLSGQFAPWSKNANAAFYFDQWLLPKLRTAPESRPSATLHYAHDPVVDVRRPALDNTADRQRSLLLVHTTSLTLRPDNVQDNAQDNVQDKGDSSSTETMLPDDSIAADDPATLEENADDISDRRALSLPEWMRLWFFSNEEPYRFNRGGYTTLNFIPSIATTLLGVLCGQLLIQRRTPRWGKLLILVVAAGVCIQIGVTLGSVACPVVKRIWTPSWVFLSGGYVIGMLAVFYLLFDLLPLRLLAFPLVVVGSNSILIYILSHEASGWVRDNLVRVHLSGFIESLFGPKALDPLWYAPVTLPATVFLLYWLLLLWLYRQKAFLRI